MGSSSSYQTIFSFKEKGLYKDNNKQYYWKHKDTYTEVDVIRYVDYNSRVYKQLNKELKEYNIQNLLYSNINGIKINPNYCLFIDDPNIVRISNKESIEKANKIRGGDLIIYNIKSSGLHSIDLYIWIFCNNNLWREKL